MRKFALCFATGFALLISGCGGEIGDRTPDADDENAQTEPGDVQDGEVTVGQQVTLNGTVTKVYDDHSFSLSDEGFDWEKDLVVVTKEPLPFQAEDSASVKVTGTVKKYAVAEVETEYGWDFDPEVETELEEIEFYLADAKVEVTDPAE